MMKTNKKKPGKGRMKLDAAVTQVMKLEAEWRGIVAQAHRESWSHDRILKERTKRIQGHPNYPRLPAYLRRELMRFTSGSLAVLDVTCVHWQLYLDGKRVAHADVPSGAWDRVKGRMEWIHSGEVYSTAKRDR